MSFLHEIFNSSFDIVETFHLFPVKKKDGVIYFFIFLCCSSCTQRANNISISTKMDKIEYCAVIRYWFLKKKTNDGYGTNRMMFMGTLYLRDYQQ